VVGESDQAVRLIDNVAVSVTSPAKVLQEIAS
jgi:hypothetical protein